VMAEAILTLRNWGSGAKGIDFRPKLDYTEVVFRGAMEIASRLCSVRGGDQDGGPPWCRRF